MKELNVKLYTIDELPKSAQENVIKQERRNIQKFVMRDCDGDYEDTLRHFCEATDTEVDEYDVDSYGVKLNYSFHFDYNKEIMKNLSPNDICGKLLNRWVSRFVELRLEGRYYAVFSNNHFRERRSKITSGPIEGGWCPFTGRIYDTTIIDPIVNYYLHKGKYADDYSLYDLIDDCYYAFFLEWKKKYEYWADDKDAIFEKLHNNQFKGRLYFEDGTLCNVKVLINQF